MPRKARRKVEYSEKPACSAAFITGMPLRISSPAHTSRFWQNLLALGIDTVAVLLLLGGAAAEDVPVHGDEQLLAQRIRQPGGAEFPGTGGLLQVLDGAHIVQPALPVKAQQVEPPLLSQLETGLPRLAGISPPHQPLPSQPDYHQLIG